MCARYRFTNEKLVAFRRLYGDLHPGVTLPTRVHNIGPTHLAYVVAGGKTSPAVGSLPFGWLTRIGDTQKLVVNARSETVADKPLFSKALQTQRCVVPASGWYEWAGEANNKKPYYIYPANDALLLMAGLWLRETYPDQPPRTGFVILTQAATPPVAQLHHRQPVLLDAELAGYWLNVPQSAGDLSTICQANPPFALHTHAVSERVNSIQHDSPTLADPVPVTGDLFG